MQKVADKVRVNVQLINAQTDSHLWADTYDRKVTDMFEAESEIAKRVAETLQAKLTGREKQALAVKPTNNPEAYEAYLRGLSLDERNYISSPPSISQRKLPLLMSGRCSLTPILRLHGRGFRSQTQLFLTVVMTLLLLLLGRRQRNVLWTRRRNWRRTHLKP